MSEVRRVLASGKRKTAKALAVITEGTGKIRVNGLALHVYFPDEFVRAMVLEPLWLAGEEVYCLLYTSPSPRDRG